MMSFAAADTLDDANLLHAAIVPRNFLCSFLLCKASAALFC